MTREEQATVNAIWKFLEEQERRRKDLRQRDDLWRNEVKTDIKELKEALCEMPCVMDAKIAACREDREGVTKDAVEDAATRHSLAKVAADWRTWVAFGIAVGAFALGWMRP